MNADADDDRARPWWALLRDRVFGFFVAAKLGTLMAVWIHNIVSSILAFEITGSALVVGLVGIAQFAPLILLSPAGGLLADRLGQKPLMIGGRLISAGGSGGMALYLALNPEPSATAVASLFASALVVGTGFAMGGPAMQAVIPSLVAPRDLPGAVALDNMPLMVGRAFGPALGAALITTAGFAAAFAAAAIGHLVFVTIVAALPVGAKQPTPRRFDAPRAGLFGYLRQRPAALRLILAIAAVGFAVDPVLTLGPALAVTLGEGTETAANFASAFGLGALVGFAALPLLRRVLGEERLTASGLILLGAGTLAVAPLPSVPAGIAAFVVAGAGMTVAVTGSTTALHRAVTDPWRARVMAVWIIGFVGMRPIASIANGAISDLGTPTVAVAITGALVALCAIPCRPSRISP